MSGPQRTVVLGVTASDAHAVANQLIAAHLRATGFHVVNLGACTPISEFVEALRRNPHAEALLVGSLNGHAYQDLRDLPEACASGAIPCPIVLGGNLSVGATKRSSDFERFYDLGVTRIVEDARDLVDVLDQMAEQRVTRWSSSTPSTRRGAAPVQRIAMPSR
jgi:methylaspartate mutase sigma subunit